MELLHRIRTWASKIPICYRIVIANAVVAALGLILITWITYNAAQRSASPLLIILIVGAGIAFSFFLNLVLVRTALIPLVELQRFSLGIKSLSIPQQNLVLTNPDPDTFQLANTLVEIISQLENNNKRLRIISERAINAQEEERRRIARWLHDDTGQALLSLIINLEYIEKKVPPDHADLQETIAKATQLSKQTLDELRVIIYGLRPSILDDLGLGPAIRWYARSKLEEAGINVTINIPDNLMDLSPRLRTSLFRIAQEAINNIVRHSQASNAIISLDTDGKEIYLSVEDNGRGFFAAQNQGEAVRLQQWGLVGIEERVELINGEFSLTSEPDQGTLLQIYAPLVQENEVHHGQN